MSSRSFKVAPFKVTLHFLHLSSLPHPHNLAWAGAGVAEIMVTDMRVGRARGHRALATGMGPAAAAPCGPLARDPHSRGGRDSRFPATRSTGRFQPRPIFGESLSRLRHPAPRGRRSWELARRPRSRRGVPEKCIPAAHARVPPDARDPKAGGARSPQHLNPRPPARESRNQACAVGEAGGTGSCKDYVTFPVHPAVDSFSLRGSKWPLRARHRGYAQELGAGDFV